MDCQLGALPTFSDLKQFTDEELHSTFRFSQNPRVNKISGRNPQGKSTQTHEEKPYIVTNIYTSFHSVASFACCSVLQIIYTLSHFITFHPFFFLFTPTDNHAATSHIIFRAMFLVAGGQKLIKKRFFNTTLGLVAG